MSQGLYRHNVNFPELQLISWCRHVPIGLLSSRIFTLGCLYRLEVVNLRVSALIDTINNEYNR